MERLFKTQLVKWNNSNTKKPLMVIGARQIGKTYTILEFIKENFKEYLYFNLEKEEEIKKIFENTIDEEKIIEEIELNIGKKIDVENTIIFFDEIQVSEKCIVSLKYFCESKKNYKIICAGSLLGVKLNRFENSFPVGKVCIQQMHPMCFEEFLIATENKIILDKIKDCYAKMEAMPSTIHEKAMSLYRKYLCVGGMPESVNNYINNNQDIILFDKTIPSSLCDMYTFDMKKYVKDSLETTRIENIYKNIPIQLAKENKKFNYSLLQEGARKRMYDASMNWILSSSMVSICNRVKKPSPPLKVYVDSSDFKLYLSDLGMLSSLAELNFKNIILDEDFEFKGAIVENYIACELRNKNISLYYFKEGQSLKINYLLDNESGIIPIEVKSGTNTKSKSLNEYIKKYKPSYAIRISAKNFGFENNIKSIPLYAVFCI